MNEHEETDDCPFDHWQARDLFAVAHNASKALRAAIDGTGDVSRARRKLRDLEDAIARYQPLMDEHHAKRKP